MVHKDSTPRENGDGKSLDPNACMRSEDRDCEQGQVTKTKMMIAIVPDPKLRERRPRHLALSAITAVIERDQTRIRMQGPLFRPTTPNPPGTSNRRSCLYWFPVASVLVTEGGNRNFFQLDALQVQRLFFVSWKS